jgi:hypothetical protein
MKVYWTGGKDSFPLSTMASNAVKADRYMFNDSGWKAIDLDGRYPGSSIDVSKNTLFFFAKDFMSLRVGLTMYIDHDNFYVGSRSTGLDLACGIYARGGVKRERSGANAPIKIAPPNQAANDDLSKAGCYVQIGKLNTKESHHIQEKHIIEGMWLKQVASWVGVKTAGN